MIYRISESPLILKEYGRNIQSMVEFAKTVEDRDERTTVTHEIIRIMANLHPHIKEIPDYKKKLWDHLYHIAGFELDVDSPYPMPTKEEALGKPEKRLEYQKGIPKYRQYGRNVELMVAKAIEIEDEEEKKAFINLIANTMKQFLRNMDRETTPEHVLAEHIVELSKGKLKVNPDELVILKASTLKNTHRANSHSHSNSKRGKHHKNGKKNNKNRRRR